MKKTKLARTLMASLPVLLAATAIVTSEGHAQGYQVETGTVETINVQANGTWWLRLDGVPTLCSADSAPNTAVASSARSTGLGTTTDEGVERMLKTALSANLSGRQVKVRVEDSTGWGCTLAAVAIDE
ncbi:MAG: hypothetical protein ACODAG_01135 [Myxococcota bacterium]